MIEAFARRYGLDRAAEGRLATLLDALTGDPLAPTSVRDPRRVLEDHLADSLVALDLAAVRNAAQIADLGSGAGVPGLPLAIALPGAEVYLVESNGRKCQFISRLIAACGLANATVVNARAEDWPDGLGRFDLVTARALAPLAVVAEYAAPLLRLGGTLLVWRGRRDPADEQSALVAAGELGLDMPEAIAVDPYPGAANRHLQPMIKRAPTPQRFPRRTGMARKRPLGGASAPTSDRRRR
ncbi:MAG TPA: 16S rRNA (guanine(527)-N(7))-methyltransferase RsmG [Solirubrobacteraceae bacterium]|nr:16S rRNA (guanine(527)-N(7))-methyltransferase RsmG [Solirubrobacteraceae bacterium]